MFVFTDTLPIIFWVGCKKTTVWTSKVNQTSCSLEECFLKLWTRSGHGSRANTWDCSGASTFVRRPPASLLLLGESKLTLSISFLLILKQALIRQSASYWEPCSRSLQSSAEGGKHLIRVYAIFLNSMLANFPKASTVE